MAFSEEEVRRLREERLDHPHPRVRRKMEVLLLKSQGLAHRQISAIAGISETTLREYLREYQAGGIRKLKELRFRRPRGVLEEHQGVLRAYFQDHPPGTVKEAAAEIERLTGIRRGLTQVRRLLRSLGLRSMRARLPAPSLLRHPVGASVLAEPESSAVESGRTIAGTLAEAFGITAIELEEASGPS